MLRWKFESGFSQTLRKQRLADLLEIHQLLKKNSYNLDLTSENLQALHNASKELKTFYISGVSNYRELELLIQQLNSSTAVLLKKDKVHKASLRSLETTLARLEPSVNSLILKELEKTNIKSTGISTEA
jgi:hypothetical protein